MSAKKLIYFGMIVGSIIGGYIPSLFGLSSISFTSLFSSAIGAFIGIWAMYKLTR